jgi:hypothetical protein
MGFLDNSGDIILDAVLTDTGRMRLAKGDGSFRITKFSLADDEIDYSLFNRNNPSGSAYFDLEILQTPVLEAFTNNGSSMKNKLITITRNNLLYLPVLKLNNLKPGYVTSISQIVQNGFLLAVDKDTEAYLRNSALKYNGSFINQLGILNGVSLDGARIKVDQGIDNVKVPPALTLDPDLKETQYIIEVDNRLMSVVGTDRQTFPVPSYIDDDDIASYYLSQQGSEDKFIRDIDPDPQGNRGNEVIAGSRGTSIELVLRASLETSTSDYLFTQFGTNVTANFSGVTATNVRSILTNMNITGVTTGFGIDIPIRLIKKIA